MNYSYIRKQLFHPRTNKYHFIAQLKNESNFKTFKKKIRAIESHPIGKHALSSTPLPKNFSHLRRNNIVPHSGNLESEIAWTLESIKKNSKELISFLDLKSQFENFIMLSKFDAATKVLEQISSQICVSNWGIENSFILAEEMEGTEKNWLLLNDYSDKLEDSLSLFLAEQNSKKSEEKLSYSRFKNNFEGVTSGISSLLNEYLCFKLLYSGYIGFQNFSFFINVESVSAIIDRYLLLVDILSELIVYEEHNDLVKTVSEELHKIIPNDFRVSQLYQISSGKLDASKINNDVMSLLDNYTSGEYNSCIKDSQILVEKYPSSIEIYLIYVKSLIELNLDFQLLSSSTMNVFAENLYIVFSKKEGYEKSLEDLMKISLKYFSFEIGKQLFSVVSKMAKLQDINGNHTLLYCLNSRYFNPIFLVDVFKLNSSLKARMEQTINSLESNYECFKLNKLIFQGDYEAIINSKSISDQRKPVYAARALNRTHNNSKLIKFIEEVENFETLSSASKWELSELLFNAYLDEEKFSEAVDLLIENYFSNRNFTTSLNTEKLLEKLKERNLHIKGINLPIFYSIVNPDIYELFVRYDNYIEEIEIERPSQIFSLNIEQDKLIYFLKEICTIEVLHHSLNFEGTDDIETERLNILLHLLVIDPELETEYIKEITEITQRSKIRKAIREVNKGRITLNSQLLRNSIENEIKDNFLRFKELVDFTEEHKLKSIDPTSKLLNSYFNSMQEKALRDRYVNINDPAYISFKTMIIDIRDKFIVSKDFGLDGYLSTRIRHGTFLNHIRSNFESLNLINQKKGEDYLENQHWNQVFPSYLKDKLGLIQERMKTFSKEIDDFTEYLIKEQIQIRTEKHTQKKFALFDFSIDDRILAYLYSEIKGDLKSHNIFLNVIFEYLEAKTRIELKKIREYFRSSINEKYTILIKQFDGDIRKILDDASFVDLTNSIVKCQTNIQNEILNISEWFSIANPSSELTLDIQTIVRTALEITNTIYPNQTLEPEISVGNNIPFAGGTTNMIYIIRILLDNIIKHSGLPVSDRNITVESNIINNTSLSLKVSNNFDEKYKAQISSNLSKVKKKWSNKKSDFAMSNIEGGSGFDKIRRILAVDMNMNNYDFNYSIEGNRVSIEIIIQIKIMTTDNE